MGVRINELSSFFIFFITKNKNYINFTCTILVNSLQADLLLTSLLGSARPWRRADGLLFEIQKTHCHPKGSAHWGNAACQIS